MRRKIIAVTGGIGAGKSVVCSTLAVMGFPIYDCDSRAKQIMDADSGIKEQLIMRVTPCALDASGNIDRKAVSNVVFNDSEKLKELNSIVHGAVREDILKWANKIRGMAFIETAILYQSGIDKMVEEVWEVTAPLDVKVVRVCKRNCISEDEVLTRINSQNITIEKPHKNNTILINDDSHSLLLQIS